MREQAPQPTVARGPRRLAHLTALAGTVRDPIVAAQEPKGGRPHRCTSWGAIVALAVLYLMAYAPPVSAAVSISLLASTGAASGTTCVTGSVAPAANSLNLVWAHSSGVTINQPTVTGNGLTWDLVTSTANTTSKRMWLFRAMGASPTAGAITVTYGTSQDDLLCAAVTATGVDTSGSNGSGAIGETQASNLAAQTSVTLTLSGFSASGNRAVMVAAANSSATSTTFEWTSLADTSVSNAGRIATQWKDATDDLSGTMSWGVESATRAGILVEVKAAASGCRGGMLMGRVGC
jgi:hypothetical protein